MPTWKRFRAFNLHSSEIFRPKKQVGSEAGHENIALFFSLDMKCKPKRACRILRVTVRCISEWRCRRGKLEWNRFQNQSYRGRKGVHMKLLRL